VIGSTSFNPSAKMAGVVIEELQFICANTDRERFLEVEAAVWTSFLATCDGFVHKEVWLPEDDPDRVIVMIWWNSLEQWKRITAEQCDEVDRAMGEWLRPIDVARTHVVARSTEPNSPSFEAEATPSNDVLPTTP
jgi:uncharacterized protein (TIGR03792 family)